MQAIAQAGVKILAGEEVGISPIAAMNGIYIVKGKPSFSSFLMSTVAGRAGYRFMAVEHTAEIAKLDVYHRDKKIGQSSFSMAEAKNAGLLGNDVWRKFPKNMLWARAISNACKWYCAEAFGGVTPYTPEELGAAVDGEENVIEIQPKRVQELKNQVQAIKAQAPITIEETNDAIDGNPEYEWKQHEVKFRNHDDDTTDKAMQETYRAEAVEVPDEEAFLEPDEIQQQIPTVDQAKTPSEVYRIQGKHLLEGEPVNEIGTKTLQQVLAKKENVKGLTEADVGQLVAELERRGVTYVRKEAGTES